MISCAKLKFIRIAPRKARLVADVIRGQDVNFALSRLTFLNKRASDPLRKLLTSAVNNAKVKGFEANQLFVSKINIDQGPMWKRYKAGSFGRAAPILRRTSHFNIELDLKKAPQVLKEVSKKIKAAPKIIKPIMKATKTAKEKRITSKKKAVAK